MAIILSTSREPNQYQNEQEKRFREVQGNEGEITGHVSKRYYQRPVYSPDAGVADIRDLQMAYKKEDCDK